MKIKLHFSNLRTITLVVMVLFLTMFSSSAQTTRTSTGNTDWNTASTWNPAEIPSAGDIIHKGRRCSHSKFNS